MTIWTPKHEAGVRTHWHPETGGKWDKSNILIYSTQIKQVRLIHLENVYRYMWHYFTEEGWGHIGPKGARFEDFYGEARDQHGHKEIRWWWRMQRSPGGMGGKHSYFRQRLYVDCLTTGMKRTEIMYKGQKIKPYVGEFVLFLNGILQLDYQGWFSGEADSGPYKGKKHWLLGVLEDFFPRMIYKDRVREQEIELRRVCERYVEDIKHYIGLHRLADVRKPMDPNQQWQ